MKDKLLIVFKSTHGYVKRYVDILGNELGCDAVPSDKLRANMLAGYDKILFIGPVRSRQLVGFPKVSELLYAAYDRLIVCGVGLLPYRKEIADRIKDGTVSVVYEKFVPVFYAQGGFDMDELTRTEKMAYSMVVRNIKASGLIDEDGTCMLKAAAQPLDEVKKENIRPLIDFLDGKTVDEALYSPAEISDPEEQKQYLAEQEKEAQAPTDKKRALKKQLKK